MPIFEYRCEECNHRFDAFFRRADEADLKRMTCSKCDSERVRKLFPVIGPGPEQKDTSGTSCSARSK